MRIVIVIPCYNEREHIKSILDEISTTLKGFEFDNYQVIIIDDCSTDDSYQQIESYVAAARYPTRFSFHRNEKNIGTAQSIIRLLQKAVKSRPDFVIKMDMDKDFSHKEVLKTFFQHLATSNGSLNNTVVTGIRTLENEKQMTLYERIRKVMMKDFLRQQMSLRGYDPVSAGTQLYPFPILSLLLKIEAVKKYNLRWGVDVLLPLLSRKMGNQLLNVPINNSNYNLERRKDDKVKSQYDAFSHVFNLVEGFEL